MSNILAVIAHPDDELACAGTLIKHVQHGDKVRIVVITAGTSGPGKVSERVHEMACSAKVIGADLAWGDFLDGQVSSHEKELVHFIESQINDWNADVVYAHCPNDSHQDHRAVAHATLGAARKCANILQFEAPSAINFQPTLFVDISDTLDRKVEAVACHDTQVASSRMIDLDYLRGSAIYRGFQSRTTAAEAFVPVRYTLTFGGAS